MLIKRQLDQFIEYVNGFYGIGGIYEMDKITLKDIVNACNAYMYTLLNGDNEGMTWGDGDSLDRERVRYILENEMGFIEKADKKGVDNAYI